MIKNKRIMCIAICLCVILLVIAVVIIVLPIDKQRIADNMYASVRSAIRETLNGEKRNEYAVICFKDETGHYLLLHNAEWQLSAIKTPEGESVYYTNNQRWIESADGVLGDAAICEDSIYPHITGSLMQLIKQEDVTYSYNKATERFVAQRGLPYWIRMNDTYIDCQRFGYEDHFERMTIHEESNGDCVYWYIYSLEENEDNQSPWVYAHICDIQCNHGGYYIKDIWGTLPEEILKQIRLKPEDARA